MIAAPHANASSSSVRVFIAGQATDSCQATCARQASSGVVGGRKAVVVARVVLGVIERVVPVAPLEAFEVSDLARQLEPVERAGVDEREEARPGRLHGGDEVG